MMTIEEFGRRLRAREITAVRVTEACLRRIEAENPRLNAFILVMAEQALRQAREADRELAAGHDRGPLHGVPISIKDLLDMRGVPTTAASRVREGHVATHDATTIAHLRQAGAVFLGKTNLHEFAFGTTNEDSAFGPARNPHDPARSPGGSSGGSAASVASGMALATIGTDTGGSIRIPAAACGLVGLKPSFGEVSTDGVVPLSRTLDHVGPLALNVTDACLVYHALMGDASAAPPAPMPTHGLRLGVPRTYFCDLLDDDVRARFEETLDRLRAAGVHIDEIDIHHAETTSRPIYLHLVLGDAAAYHAATLDTMPEKYTKPVRLRLEMARYEMAEDYVQALAGRDRAAARSGRRAGATRRARVAGPGDSGAAHRRRRRPDRRSATTHPQRDVTPHAALQRHRPPGDFDARAAGQRDGIAVRAAARRQADAHGRPASGCPGLRGSDRRAVVAIRP